MIDLTLVLRALKKTSEFSKPRRWIASKPGYQVVVGLVSRSMIGLILVLAITIDTTTPIGSAIIAL